LNVFLIRDAIFIGFADLGTALLSGSVVFAVLGFLAHELGVTVGEVVQSGEGLSFVAYPEAVSKLPFSPVWGVLFFSMMVACGMDSEVSVNVPNTYLVS
jgi:SNF family Na+-dependent transporter